MVCYCTWHYLDMPTTNRSNVHDIILICLLQTEVLYRALSLYTYYKPKYCTGHYRQIFNSSALKQLNGLSCQHYTHFQHISATTKRSSKKLNTGLMQKVMLTEIQVFRNVMLCRRVVTDVSKHRSTVSFRANQWNNTNLRLIHPGDEPNTVAPVSRQRSAISLSWLRTCLLCSHHKVPPTNTPCSRPHP